MPSLQETVEQQAATIQQLSEIVAKSEARHRSLERMIRWMGVGVFVLAIVLVMPIKQDLFSVAHANTPPEQQSPVNNMLCGSAGQLLMNMPCGKVISMAKVENLNNTAFGYSTAFLDLIGTRISNDIAELQQQKQHAPESEKVYLTNRIAELEKLLEVAKDKDGNSEKDIYGNDVIVGNKLTLMDHIANIDYDFDNLTTIGRIIPQLIGDMNNMSNQMNVMSANMSSMDKNMGNMSGRMDTMARDMHNMNSMAFDIHNMAATGVPVMGRMNNATSWMPWW